MAGGGATQLVVATNQAIESDSRINAPTAEEMALLNNTILGAGPSNVPAKSVPIDPITGLPIASENIVATDKEPRGNKKFRFTFT